MPFTRPSLQQIIERILGDITAKLGEKSSILRRAWTRVWATAFGGASHMLHGHIAWVKDQYFVTSADEEALVEKGNFYGLTRGTAEYAFGVIDATGTNTAVIPKDAVWVDAAGTRFIVQTQAVISSGTAEVNVKCAETGIKGNLVSGTLVELESPIPGVNNQGTVSMSAPIDLGADLETLDGLRARILARQVNPPQGGSRTDYEAWARLESGLGEVTVYGPGEISTNPYIPPYGYVYVYFSEAGSTVTPSGAKILAVKNKILPKMPITARLEVRGIEFLGVTFVIQAKPSSGFTFDQMVEDIQAELIDLFLDSALPYATLTLANINEAISRPASEQTHILVSPAADVTFAYNQMGRVVTDITVTPL